MPSAKTTPVEAHEKPWAIYARLSKKQDGGLVKCEYQVQVCTDYATANAIDIDPDLVFIDNSLSAWAKGVKRPDWDRMLEMARSREFPGILLWEVSRFARRHRDMEDLIDLADTGSMTIAGPAGRFDLTTASGRRDARAATGQAAAESDFISERAKAGIARKTKQGKPIGGAGRPFGFEKGRVEHCPEEVEVIREVARRMLADEPTVAILADLNARGVETVRGGQFTVANLTRMMARPVNGGHVIHHGHVVATMPGEPILDPDTYDTLQAKITARRRGRKPNAGRFPLTGLLVCSDCGVTMNGKGEMARDGRSYVCPPGRGGCSRTIEASGVEALVDAYMVKWLSRSSHMRNLTAREKRLNESRRDQLVQVEAVESQLSDLEVKWASGELVQQAYDRAKPVLDRRLAVEQSKLAELSRQSVTVNPVAAEKDWQQMTPAEKRTLIARSRTTITIGPYIPGPIPRRFNDKRVTIETPKA
jgi:site-specific DNA recombinase